MWNGKYKIIKRYSNFVNYNKIFNKYSSKYYAWHFSVSFYKLITRKHHLTMINKALSSISNKKNLRINCDQWSTKLIKRVENS